MKKIFLLFIALACALSLAACGAWLEPIQTDTDKTVDNNTLPPANEDQNTYESLTDRAAPDVSYKLGDVNKDGKISNGDILLLYRYIYSPTLYPLEDGTNPSPFSLGDVNKDGKISNSDILMFYKYMFNSTLYPLEEETTEVETEEETEEVTDPPFMGGGVWM